MNDGRYRAFDDQIFSIFSDGHRHIIKQLKSRVPGVRITAIQPSPYDDVVRQLNFAVDTRGAVTLQQIPHEIGPTPHCAANPHGPCRSRASRSPDHGGVAPEGVGTRPLW
jgi:hypothetical protein